MEKKIKVSAYSTVQTVQSAYIEHNIKKSLKDQFYIYIIVHMVLPIVVKMVLEQTGAQSSLLK